MNDPNPPQAAEILEEAATVIETRGWYQGGFQDPASEPGACPVCALGAINIAAGEDAAEVFGSDDYRQDAALALIDFLHLRERLDEFEGIEEVVGDYWNDEVATSPEQVMSALRECATALKAGA